MGNLQRSHAQISVLFKIKTWIDILVTVPMINTNAYSFEICTTWRSDFFQAAVIDRIKVHIHLQETTTF